MERRELKRRRLVLSAPRIGLCGLFGFSIQKKDRRKLFAFCSNALHRDIVTCSKKTTLLPVHDFHVFQLSRRERDGTGDSDEMLHIASICLNQHPREAEGISPFRKEHRSLMSSNTFQIRKVQFIKEEKGIC